MIHSKSHHHGHNVKAILHINDKRTLTTTLMRSSSGGMGTMSNENNRRMRPPTQWQVFVKISPSSMRRMWWTMETHNVVIVVVVLDDFDDGCRNLWRCSHAVLAWDTPHHTAMIEKLYCQIIEIHNVRCEDGDGDGDYVEPRGREKWGHPDDGDGDGELLTHEFLLRMGSELFPTTVRYLREFCTAYCIIWRLDSLCPLYHEGTAISRRHPMVLHQHDETHRDSGKQTQYRPRHSS